MSCSFGTSLWSDCRYLSQARLFFPCLTGRGDDFYAQPASITKVVTALVIIEMAERMREPARIDFYRRKCTVSTLASSFASWTAEYGWNNGDCSRILHIGNPQSIGMLPDAAEARIRRSRTG